MADFEYFYHVMPDGTIKQINPFTETEVWTVPGRAARPHTNVKEEDKKEIEVKYPEDYCNFCEARYFNTPPEKARVVRKDDGSWEILYRLPPEEVKDHPAEFRRVGNLFEIVTFDYWNKNYGYDLDEELQKWMDKYLSNPKGYEHVMNVLNIKLKAAGRNPDEVSFNEKIAMAKAFFGGGHELIIARRHYKPGAKFSYELASAGELTEEEHFWYYKFTIETMKDMIRHNHYIRYISVFQNWLRPAGASFDHLHRQLVALDEWGVSIEQEIKKVRQNPNIYNEYAANFAMYHNFIIAENDYAIAFADFGHRFPTIAIYSKSTNIRPTEHTDEEIKGISDIVRAMHVAMTSQLTCNEEWYYTPFDAIDVAPWHILIKWRLNIPAGFEGNTKIYINPYSPDRIKEFMVPRLIEARDKGLISGDIRIDGEVDIRANPLQYYRNNLRYKSVHNGYQFD